MADNKENRDSKPKTEGERHQGVGVNTPEKKSADPDKSALEKAARKGGNTPNT